MGGQDGKEPEDAKGEVDARNLQDGIGLGKQPDEAKHKVGARNLLN